MNFRKKIKDIIPQQLWIKLHNLRSNLSMYLTILNARYNHRLVIRRLRCKKDPISVYFFVNYSSVWKYDKLFKRLVADSTFAPQVVICPVVNKGHDHMVQTIDECEAYFNAKGYPFICAYNKKTGVFLESKELAADIIFYTSPYKGVIDDRYYISNYKKSLSCYISYAYINVPHKYTVALPFHEMLWRFYIECPDNYNQAKSLALSKAKNCVVTGYTMYDDLNRKEWNEDNWKNKDKVYKRIIWAPHHSIQTNDDTALIHFSTFLQYYDTIYKLSQKYMNKIQFVFKPHPILKSMLYAHPEWGQERTDAYYKLWEEGENTSYCNGEYIDLFLSSDALIHDCGSFIIEYLYTKKPCLFLVSQSRLDECNIVSKKAFAVHHHAYKQEDIEQFIEEVILNNDDSKSSDREQFYNNVLLPPNNQSVTDNIINDIKTAINKKLNI